MGCLYRRAFAEARFEPGSEAIGQAAAAALSARVSLRLPTVEHVVEETGPFRTTAKALLRFDDGQRVECVRIPVARRTPEPGPATLCVLFRGGLPHGLRLLRIWLLARDLRPEGDRGPVRTARLTLGWEIGQIVFMGMGEPLDNFENLAGALAVFLDESGPAFSQDDITVCTLGLPEGIARLRGLGLKRLNLSVSLNAPDEGLRGELMPASRGVGLEALAAVSADYSQRRNFALAVNYCLIPGRNDGEGAAEGVAPSCGRRRRPAGPSATSFPTIPGSSPSAGPPTRAEIESFRRRLRAAGAFVKLRSPRGRALMAACGQLGRVD